MEQPRGKWPTVRTAGQLLGAAVSLGLSIYLFSAGRSIATAIAFALLGLGLIAVLIIRLRRRGRPPEVDLYRQALWTTVGVFAAAVALTVATIVVQSPARALFGLSALGAFVLAGMGVYMLRKARHLRSDDR